MKLNVISPEGASLQVVEAAIDQGQTLYRSPHVGNVNNSELSLMLGIAEMGGCMQVELVDTIRGDDSYSNPQSLLVGGAKKALVSRNYAKSRVVGGCAVAPEVIEAVKLDGVKVNEDVPVTLKTLHTGALQQALPETVVVTNSSEYFATIGEQAYQLVLQESLELINRPLRVVDTEGKIREAIDPLEMQDIFGLGEEPMRGLLPPLEGMMAIEVIKKVLDGNGSDAQILHIGGPDMVRYTKAPEVMEPVAFIANRVLGQLGIGQNVSVQYVVPCMKTIIESPAFDRTIGSQVMSQYDILAGSR